MLEYTLQTTTKNILRKAYKFNILGQTPLNQS